MTEALDRSTLWLQGRRVRQLLRQPHPRSSEHNSAPATDGSRISLSGLSAVCHDVTKGTEVGG